MSNHDNHRRGESKRTEHGPQWEGPETDRNSARSRAKWRRLGARKERRTGKATGVLRMVGRYGGAPEADCE